MTGAGECGGDPAEHWARVASVLAEAERSAASELGEGETAPVREYLEHNELGLALDLLVSIVMRAGLDPARYHDRVREAAGRMGMADSEHMAAWRRYCRRA